MYKKVLDSPQSIFINKIIEKRYEIYYKSLGKNNTVQLITNLTTFIDLYMEYYLIFFNIFK